jgi:hypothetical protein
MARYTSPALTFLGLALMIAAMAACDEQCEDRPTGAADLEQIGFRNPITGVCESFGGTTGSGDNCGDFGGDRDLAEPAPNPDYAQCFAGCEGLDETSCTDAPGCRAIYLSDCPADAVCDSINYNFVDCWGVAPASPDPSLACEGLDAYNCSRSQDCAARHLQDLNGNLGEFESCASETGVGPEGSCVGEPACNSLPPDCPSGTVPGRDETCWTGFCIPLDECDQIPACGSLGERDCVDRADCAPDYRGEDCTCDATGCTCADFTFAGCGERS